MYWYFDIKQKYAMAIVNEVSICFSISFLKYCAPLDLYIVSNYWMSYDKNNSKKYTLSIDPESIFENDIIL